MGQVMEEKKHPEQAYTPLKQVWKHTGQRGISTDQFVSWLVSSEWDNRINCAVERAIRQAPFRYKAAIEEIDYSVERGLDKNLTGRLADLTFVRERKDLFIIGSAGIG